MHLILTGYETTCGFSGVENPHDLRIVVNLLKPADYDGPHAGSGWEVEPRCGRTATWRAFGAGSWTEPTGLCDEHMTHVEECSDCGRFFAAFVALPSDVGATVSA